MCKLESPKVDTFGDFKIQKMVNNMLPQRKKIRLKNYDYNSSGAYFVTICVKDRKRLLSKIIEMNSPKSVGDGAHDVPDYTNGTVTRRTYQIELTPIGRIVEKHLLSSENISGVKIDQYVIMPDHIHVIFFTKNKESDNLEGGTSRAPSPTNKVLPHIISTFKRFCNKEIGHNIFQRSYMEHIIRDTDDYKARRRYIYENPMRWYYKNLE